MPRWPRLSSKAGQGLGSGDHDRVQAGGAREVRQVDPSRRHGQHLAVILSQREEELVDHDARRDLHHREDGAQSGCLKEQRASRAQERLDPPLQREEYHKRDDD